MKQIKSLLIISAAATAFAVSPVISAQVNDAVKDKVVDTVKDEAVKKVKDAAKDKAYGSATKAASETVDAGTVEKAKAYGSGKAEGEVHDAADKAKAYGSGKAEGEVQKAKSYGSGNKGTVKSQGYGSANQSTSTTTSSTAIACPAGTTAQPNGTCMITGDYKGS